MLITNTFNEVLAVFCETASSLSFRSSTPYIHSLKKISEEIGGKDYTKQLISIKENQYLYERSDMIKLTDDEKLEHILGRNPSKYK